MTNRSILLVDDVELFLELEKTFFHREGFDLLMAVNSQEVLRLVQQRQPDLVFLDMHISGARGDELCRWIKQNPNHPGCKVIMLVQSGDLEAESLSRQAGCDAILHTPVKRRELLGIARNLLDLCDRQQARMKRRVLVHYAPEDGDFDSFFTVNMSPGGLFLATDRIFPVGTPLQLKVQLPGKGDLQCLGQVAWLNHPREASKPHFPMGMGIQFISFDENQQRRIKDYLTQDAA